MPKISVIVPVYNVEKYIERCARSLFNQTLDEIEFVFVDDCSPDNSIELLKSVISEFPHRQSQVKLCSHSYNKGLPTARKTGVEVATGDYIAHCDSDDWTDPNMYEKMYLTAVSSNSDIVYCDYYVSSGMTHSIVKLSSYSDGLLQGPVWNKLARRELYNFIEFPVENKAEDGAIMTQLSFFANRIMHLNIPLYYYFKNPESICQLPTKDACINRWAQECINTDLRIDFLKKQGAEKKYYREIIMMKYYSLTNLIPFLSDDAVFHLWNEKYPELKKDMGLFSHLPIRTRLSYFLMRHRFVKLLLLIRK